MLWKPLSVHQGNVEVPPLLVKGVFSPTSYTIHVTDLTYIWVESLDRKQIFRRALNLDTSIDPSDGSDQLALLLQNIQRSLDGGQDTTLSFDIDRAGSNIVLKIHTTLPAPLRPLEWPIELSLDSQEDLANQFTLPCLSQQLTATNEIDFLLSEMREKDHVIGRLVESMQSFGIDFTRIFPGAGALKFGAGADVRKVLGRSVKGLQEFDYYQWQQDHPPNLKTPVSLKTLVHTLFHPNPFISSPPLTEVCYGKWWKREANLEKIGTGEMHSTLFNKPAVLHGLAMSQVQSLDAHTILELKDPQDDVRPKRIVHEPDVKNVVESGESPGTDLSTAESATQGSDQDQETSASRSRLEGHSRLKEIQHPEKNICQNPISARENFAASQEHSMPERFHREESSSAIAHPRTVHDSPRAKPRGKLGRIGGKVKQPTDNSQTTNTRTSSRNVRDQDGEVARGRSEKGLASPSKFARPKSSKKASPDMSPSPVRETSQERADRKRVELKRELDDRSKAAVKKKRKF